MSLFNETEIRKSIQQLHPDGELFEVRIIPGNKKRKPASGYFKDVDTLLEAFKIYDLRETNVYITLQQVKSSLYSRTQRDHFVAGANSTQDSEIDGYKWLFIDLDPERPTGISSSEEELKKAYALAKKISVFLQDYGFEEPVKAVSGNGAHLLYRINLGYSEENKQIVERCLKALSMMFDTDEVKVDTANFNPSRVCKLYGTLAQKGANTEDRPYRLSRIIGDAKEVKITKKAYLEKLAGELPEEKNITPTKYNNYSPSEFDIEDWMSKYGLRYNAKPWNGGTKYILDECPFDSSHKAPDSMITKSASGAIGFKCLHNHCSDYHWQDLRLKFEPNAYEYNDSDKRIEEGWLKHNRDKQTIAQADIHTEEIPMFQTALMILNREDPDPEYIKTGINKIDKALNGLEKGKISVLTGLRASAKSTILSEIMLNAIEAGHNVVCYSGELSDKSFMNWMYLQAAGKDYIQASAKYNGYYVKQDVKQKIAEWMGERFWLYNNNSKQSLDNLFNGIKQKCKDSSADLVIIDNLMALNVGELNKTNEYDAQTKFMWQLKALAIECNVHVVLVAHPRKAYGFLRLNDISGSGNISNIVDNVFIIHRVNNDFIKTTKDLFGWKDDYYLYLCSNVVEIAKDREHGTCDEFIDLYYEPETKRLKNYKAETVIYGWKIEFEDRQEDDIVPFD